MASSGRIDELRKKFDENPRRYFAPLANEYRKAGDIEQAITICREYLPQQPGHMSGHIVYGQALYEARQFDEAKAVFETALSLDPENLIALRHLGDIALILGDSEAARNWYGRVLEADPRNEEIQSQLRTLDAAAASRAAGAPTPISSPAVKPTPSSAATVVLQAVKPPQAPAPLRKEPVDRPLETVTPESATVELRLDELPGKPQPTPEIEKSVSQPLEIGEQPIPPSLEGLEATSLASHGPTSVPPETIAGFESSSAEPPGAVPDAGRLPELEMTQQASEGAQPSRSAEALPELELTPPPAPPRSEVPELELAAPPKESLAPAVVPPSSTDAAVPDLELTDLDAGPEVAPASSAGAVEAQGPFVTETMAELYLQQGHKEEALRVYRALSAQRPEDEKLRDRIASLEAGAAAPTHAAAATGAEQPAKAVPEVAPVVPEVGATIRELLAALAQRRPGYRPAIPGRNGGGGGALPAAASPIAPAVGGEDLQPLAPESFTSGAINAIFGGATVSAADDRAAMVLATAFSPGNGRARFRSDGVDVAASGAPARRATHELSLDSVFGQAAGRASAAPAFSFDQFFSERTGSGASEGSGEANAHGQGQDDVAQFTQWLEGLKRR